eukprot:716440-Amphidinium_carterae.1
MLNICKKSSVNETSLQNCCDSFSLKSCMCSLRDSQNSLNQAEVLVFELDGQIMASLRHAVHLRGNLMTAPFRAKTSHH